MKPLLIAHRSGPYIFPEQTLQSCRDALSMKADMVEMDIRLTSDGEFVICHDPNAERVFGVDKKIEDMTKAEFMSMRHKKNPAFCSHSLEDVLESGVKPILFHCKITGDAMVKLVEVLKAHDFEDQCVLGVMYADDVKTVKSMSSIKTLAFMPKIDLLDSFIASETDFIRLWEDWFTPELATKIKNAGKKLWIMSGKATPEGVGYTDAAHMKDWISCGADGILVNDIRWATKVVDEL